MMNAAGTRKYYQLMGFVALCVILNFCGKLLAAHFSWPVWADAVGTVLAAYVLGPLWGAVVGVSVNIIYGFIHPASIIYALTSLCIGVCVGFLSKYHFFDSPFKTANVGVLVAVISTFVSSFFNILIYDGITSNPWGDGVAAYLIEKGFQKHLSYIVGEFYIDFLDKLLIFDLLYLVLKLRGIVAKKRNAPKAGTLVLVFAIMCTVALSRLDVEASDTSYVQTIYNSSNGLACGEANDITQTADGILWIGTYSGLYRYNGSEIKWMDEYESIKNVNCLYVDDLDRLLIGTNDNGFSVIVDGQIKYVLDDAQGLSSNSVRCITQCADGTYYVGTTSSMQVISIDDTFSIVDTIDEVNYAICVSADGSGRVATVDTNGILYLLENEKLTASLELGEGQEIFNSCAFGEDGTLYVGTSSNHLYTYRINGGIFKLTGKYECGDLISINAVCFYNDNIFICADNGVGLFDSNMSYSRVGTGAFNNSIDSMTMDYQGNLWFASSRLGVLRLSQSRVIDYYDLFGIESKVVNTSEFWNGLLYVGTDSGLDVLNLDKETAVTNELTEALKDIRIRCIMADSSGNLWICTYGSGLWEVDSDFNISTYDTNNGKFGDRARVAIEMSDGTVVAAGDNGIAFISDGEVVYSFKYGAGLSNAMILSLMEMSDGSVMAGTDGDGIVIIKDGAVYRKITRQDGLSSGVILRTVADKTGDGTFVVTSNALCYIANDYTITTLDNFPYYNNYDIYETDDGKLFVLGSAGIYIVDRDELMSGEDVEYELLNSNNGLSTSLTVNSWNACADNRYLYLSCDNGVYGIDLASTDGNVNYYKMMISEVKLDQISYNMGNDNQLTVGRNVKRIEIVPEIINYTTYDPYVSYYLEGFETAKTVVKLSDLGSIVYTNVMPGTYTFHLEIMENDKETVLEENTYIIVKEMEIYDNTWFMVYMVFVLALFVSWFTWFVVRTQIQRTITLQKKELELAREQLEMGNQTILAIANTVDAKDENTSRHSQRVSEYSVLIARRLGKSEDECEHLRKTALLHDIGKIGIPDSVLNKPAKLTDEEYELMKSHTTRGAEILKDFTIIENVWEGALYHHERYDGSGYPLGLKGEAIPINARIIGLADAFDAMTANRVYRKKLDFNYVLNELKNGKGTQFDPELVEILLQLIDEGQINVKEIYST